MTYRGIVKDGVVHLQPAAVLADGTEVEVVPFEPASGGSASSDSLSSDRASGSAPDDDQRAVNAPR